MRRTIGSGGKEKRLYPRLPAPRAGARGHRVAARARLGRNQRAQRIGVAEPCRLDFLRHLVGLERFLENLPPAREVPAHDRVIPMRFAQRLAGVLHIGAEETCSELIFHFLDARAVGVAQEKADHAVLEDPVDERVDDRAQARRAAELFEQTWAHRGNRPAHIMPSCRRAASDILLGSQGGSQTRSILTPATPSTALILVSISAGSDCTAGQWGEVSVI